VRCRLGIEACKDYVQSSMGVVVEHENELYSLIIDKVGDVLRLRNEIFEMTPATLDPLWREVSSGIYRLDDALLVILDVPKFVGSVHS